MHNVIKKYYAEYARYISRYRSIPLNIDCLIPVERRLLLVLHEETKNKFIKSAKIIGNTIANYHPHGDISTYKTLVNLIRTGLASNEESGWGTPGIEDTKPASMRYTVTKSAPWIETLAFKYVKFAPWAELEMDSEPIYLPCPIPIGLIGDYDTIGFHVGVNTGVAFHKPVIPKYKLSDLVKRLKWLLENKKPIYDPEMDVLKCGPLIKPYKPDCTLNESKPNQFYKILMSGQGEVIYTPNGTIKKLKIKRGQKHVFVDMIVIQGRAPNSTFKPLNNACISGKLDLKKPLDTYNEKDKHIEILIEGKTKKTNLKQLAKNIWVKYLIKRINFKCYHCNELGKVKLYSIDDLLLNCYTNWKQAWYAKLIFDIALLNEKIISNNISSILNNIITNSNNKIKNLDGISAKIDFNKKFKIETFGKEKWIQKEIFLKPKDIEKVYNNTSIKKLIEYHNNQKELTEEFKKIKHDINNLDALAVKSLDNL